MNAPNVTYKVAKRFQELRRRYMAVRIGIVVAAAVTALMLLWMVLASCDYFWEWSLSWRKTGLLLGAGAIVAAFAGRLIVVVRDTRQRKFAAQVEHSFDEFGQRIRTVLDTVDGRVRGPQEMLAALGHQTLGRWETLSPAQLIPSHKLAASGIVCAMALLVGGGMFIAGGDVRTAMLRALGREIPYTELSVTPGDARLLEGSPVEVSLELSGRTNRDVMLRYRELAGGSPPNVEAESQWVESDLLPGGLGEGEAGKTETVDNRHARFAAGLGKADKPIEYQFVTSVETTRIYRVDVQPLIQAERVETQVAPPAYTRLDSRTFAATSVTVLEQSKVNVTIQTNHPLAEATLALGEKPSQLDPAELEPGDDRTQWTFQLPSAKSLHWQFTGAAGDGTPMTPVKGRMRVRHDSAPIVTWRDPPDEVRVHTLAELPMRVQISDDYGISESAMVFQLGGDDEYVLDDWFAEDPETATTNTTRVKLEKILPLESFALSERDYVSYYAYAIDNRAGRPQRAESDVRYIDIRPLRQFYAEIEQDPNNGGGGRVLVQLDEIIRRQRFLINRTRRLLKSSSVDLATQLGTIDRMVESQSELAGLTRFLADFFVSRGNDDVDALNQAEAAMLQAADSLAAGSFDLALVQEENALRALAEARRTLEIFLLKNPTQAQQQAFRRLARQLRQKLRRERPETEQQLADTLKRIASEQMQLGQTAMRMMNSQNMQNASGGGGGKPDPESEPQSGSASGAPRRDADSATNATTGSDNESESEDREPSADEPGGDESSGDAVEGENEPSLAEQQDELYARQTDLLERMQAIEDELSDRLASSPLMARRMEKAEAALDDLATQAREGEFNRFASGSQEAADQLREIAMQLDALAAAEPVSRVSAIRDMTASLANMERRLAEAPTQSASQGQVNSQAAMNRRGSGGQGLYDREQSAPRLARRLQRRTETIEDVLKTPVDVGDVETSEVNDILERFVEEAEFLQQLETSRDAAQQIAESDSGESGTRENEQTPGKDGAGEIGEQSSSEAGMARAIEYAEAARMLDELYRQLVTPRLARLQRIEQRAASLAQQLGGNGGRADERDPEIRSGIRMLQNDLGEEGLRELAELLSESEELDEAGKAKLETFASYGNGPVGVTFDPINSGRLAGRLLLVSAELQARIQEMFLLEISADRDAPVPAEYRRAVDRYFRVLAGDADVTDTGAVGRSSPKPNLSGDLGGSSR